MKSVLLVGLDGSERAAAQAALDAAGYRELEAGTSEFLLLADRTLVDLVAIDISPLRHGVHLVGIMELRRRHPTLPIIALCGGRDTATLLEIARQAGANATLRKPFASEKFGQATAACLRAAALA